MPRPVPIPLDGFDLYVRLDDWTVGLGIALRRSYEKHVVKAMTPFLSDGGVFVDVGANVGFYTMLAASRVGSGGRVIAVEPWGPNCALIHASVRRNGFSNVIVHEVAAADAEGSIGFRVGLQSNGNVQPDVGPDYPVRVPTATLDSLLGNEERVDVIKMDVEGAEGLVLAGMSNVIRTRRPVIFSELSGVGIRTISGISAKAFLETLTAHGYDVFHIDASGVAKGSAASIVAMLEAGSPRRFGHLDVMAVPRTA